ncbi:hypothetical protein GCM10009593_01590 [Microlunatus antarcticus]
MRNEVAYEIVSTSTTTTSARARAVRLARTARWSTAADRRVTADPAAAVRPDRGAVRPGRGAELRTGAAAAVVLAFAFAPAAAGLGSGAGVPTSKATVGSFAGSVDPDRSRACGRARGLPRPGPAPGREVGRGPDGGTAAAYLAVKRGKAEAPA